MTHTHLHPILTPFSPHPHSPRPRPHPPIAALALGLAPNLTLALAPTLTTRTLTLHPDPTPHTHTPHPHPTPTLAQVASTGDAVTAVVDLCQALTAQRTFLQEELTKLSETVVNQRAAFAKATKATEGLRAEEKMLSVRHEHALAAIDALLVEERARTAALAEKRAAASLPAESLVFIQLPAARGDMRWENTEGLEHPPPSPATADMPLPSFLTAAVEEVTARLASLAEMRQVLLREHAVDAKQLAAVATQATAKTAHAAAESAAQARARAALQRYEASLETPAIAV